MRLRKLLTVLLTLAMVVCLLPATAYAAKNTATTMRLEKTQGTVTVSNATGKNVSQTENMKLYNGYKVKTGAKSYAWISLDDTKVAKLDANSVMEVQKSDKSLTLFLSSGNMFFNVKDPLPKGENFHIKTSTMTTGIRGTSGCVRVINSRVTEIHLLTGEVLVYVEHPTLGVHKVATLQAGHKATSLIDWEAAAISGEMTEIIIELLENHEICGVCSKEIADDPELLERIQREAPHLFPEIAAAEAEERLAADAAAEEKEQEKIDEAVAKQVFPEDVDPYFEEEGGGGGGGGGSSSSAPEAVVTASSWDEFLQAIEDYNNGEEIDRIQLNGDADAAAVGEDLPEIEDNGPLTLDLGTNTLTLNNSLINNAELTITNEDGTIIGPGDGTAVVNYNYLMVEDATIDGNGYDVALQQVSGEMYVSSDATITNATTGVRVVEGDVTIANAAFENISTFIIYVDTDATLTLKGITLGENTETALLVQNYYGKVIVENGSITHSNRFIYNQGGEVIMNGGTIDLTMPENENGIYSLNGGTVEINGGTITAVGGDAVINSTQDCGDLTLNGGTITAKESMVAVNHEGTLNRPIRTALRWEYTGEAVTDENLITSQLLGGYWEEAYMSYTTSSDGKTTTHEMMDTYGTIDADAEADGTEAFLRALQTFNNGGADSTITLAADPNGGTTIAVTSEAVETIAPAYITNTASDLTIDLAGMNLSLEESLYVEPGASLKIIDSVGGGTVTGNAYSLIENMGAFELAGGTLQPDNNAISGYGDVIISGGTIDQRMEGSMAISISSEDTSGSLKMSGGKINLAEGARGAVAVSLSNAQASEMSGGTINLNGTDQIGISISDGDTFTMSGGQIYENNAETDSANQAVTFIYGEKLVLSGGTITMNNGTAVTVDTTEMLTLGNTTVKAKDPAKVLAAEDGIESGYGADGPDENGYYTLVKQNDTSLTAGTPEELLTAFNQIARENGPFVLTLQDTISMADTTDESGNPVRYPQLAVPAGKEVKLNLNGNELALQAPLLNSGTLTVEGTGTIKAVTAENSQAPAALIDNTGKLYVDGGTFEVTSNESCAIDSNGGSLYVNGGTFVVNADDSYGIHTEGGITEVNDAEFDITGWRAAGIYHVDGVDGYTDVENSTFHVAEHEQQGAYGIMYDDNVYLYVSDNNVFALPENAVNAREMGIDPRLI